MDPVALEKVLETYTLSEIIEINNLDEVDVLEFLLDEEFLHLPEAIPL